MIYEENIERIKLKCVGKTTDFCGGLRYDTTRQTIQKITGERKKYSAEGVEMKLGRME